MAPVSTPTITPVESVKELWGVALSPAGCLQCGQAHLVPENHIKQICPNCGQGLLAPQPALLRSEAPELMLPFSKERVDLHAIYANFTRGVWLHTPDFTPGRLLQRTTPVYWPMWLVDGVITGDWRAETGYDYQVKSSQESYTGSGWQTRHMVETRIRWEPRLGQLARRYENIPAPAASDHEKLTGLVGRYPLDKAVAYDADCLNTELGLAALRVPDLQPESAWPLAQSRLNQAAAEDCRQASGAQHVRSFAVHADYDELHWTQLLLPMYVSYYKDDDGKPQLVYVNGITGAVGGLRLASQRKGWQWAAILAAIAALLFLLGILSFALAVLLPQLSILGVLLVLLALAGGLLAILPAAWPWQWNRGQQAQKVVRS